MSRVRIPHAAPELTLSGPDRRNFSCRSASPTRTLRASACIWVLAAAALASGQTTLLPASSSSSDQPITAKDRADWFAANTLGPESLIGGVISAGWDTLF